MNKSIRELFEDKKLHMGRIIAGSKRYIKGEEAVWNANVISRKEGKVWFGDLELVKNGNTLKEIAKEYGETLYILRESDCRFETAKDPIDVLISKAVWSTDK